MPSYNFPTYAKKVVPTDNHFWDETVSSALNSAQPGHVAKSDLIQLVTGLFESDLNNMVNRYQGFVSNIALSQLIRQASSGAEGTNWVSLAAVEESKTIPQKQIDDIRAYGEAMFDTSHGQLYLYSYTADFLKSHLTWSNLFYLTPVWSELQLIPYWYRIGNKNLFFNVNEIFKYGDSSFSPNYKQASYPISFLMNNAALLRNAFMLTCSLSTGLTFVSTGSIVNRLSSHTGHSGSACAEKQLTESRSQAELSESFIADLGRFMSSPDDKLRQTFGVNTTMLTAHTLDYIKNYVQNQYAEKIFAEYSDNLIAAKKSAMLAAENAGSVDFGWS